MKYRMMMLAAFWSLVSPASAQMSSAALQECNSTRFAAVINFPRLLNACPEVKGLKPQHLPGLKSYVTDLQDNFVAAYGEGQLKSCKVIATNSWKNIGDEPACAMLGSTLVIAVLQGLSIELKRQATQADLYRPEVIEGQRKEASLAKKTAEEKEDADEVQQDVDNLNNDNYWRGQTDRELMGVTRKGHEAWNKNGGRGQSGNGTRDNPSQEIVERIEARKAAARAKLLRVPVAKPVTAPGTAAAKTVSVPITVDTSGIGDLIITDKAKREAGIPVCPLYELTLVVPSSVLRDSREAIDALELPINAIERCRSIALRGDFKDERFNGKRLGYFLEQTQVFMQKTRELYSKLQQAGSNSPAYSRIAKQFSDLHQSSLAFEQEASARVRALNQAKAATHEDEAARRTAAKLATAKSGQAVKDEKKEATRKPETHYLTAQDIEESYDGAEDFLETVRSTAKNPRLSFSARAVARDQADKGGEVFLNHLESKFREAERAKDKEAVKSLAAAIRHASRDREYFNEEMDKPASAPLR